MKPLAIIGVGCLFPGSTGPDELWSRIVNKVDAIRDVPATHWRAEDYLDPDPKSPDRVYAARGGFLDPLPFNPTAFGIPPSNLEATDSSQLLALLAAQQALTDCGYAPSPPTSLSHGGEGSKKPIDRSRVSVILGVTGTLQLVIPLGARLGHPIWRRALAEAGVDEATANDVVERIADGYVGWQENSFPGLLGNVVAGRIANRFDLGGTNCVVDAACASSLGAIHLAAMELAAGRADLVLTGGVDTFNDIFMFTCFSKTPALSPTGSARPFDAGADGTVLGEGLGLMVLKRLEDARRDGDRIYAVLRGVGSSSDGKGNAIYAPRREGQIEALRTAYRVAGVSPDTIELVEAHGTGTKVGDAAEAGALAEVYGATGRNGPWCALGSIKSQIGHTKAAAGAAGLIKAALALHHKVLPPTIKVSEPLEVLREPDCPLYVCSEKRPWLPSPGHPRRAGVSAFGFGGSNFHVVIEEADPTKTEIDWIGDVQIIALSAKSPGELEQKLSAWPAALPWAELCVQASRSRRQWRVESAHRLVLVVERDRTDLGRLLAQARDVVARGGITSGKAAEGIYHGQGPVAGRMAVLFPGQGAQYVGMLRDLVCHFPPAFNTFAAADHTFDGATRLVDLVYPRPAWSAEAKAAQDQALKATDVAQPALGAVSLGAWTVLESFGLKADVFAGHSYGELVGLCAAGRLTEDELFRLSRLRGQLMAEAGQSKGDPGAMLAVKAGESEIFRVLREEGLDLVLANKNAPLQTVLSGASETIDRAARAFSSRNIPGVRLAVAAAFHSPLVASAREPFRRGLAGCRFVPGRVVFANSTAEPYPDDADQSRELLAGQLAHPVLWTTEIEALYQSGVRSFVEVGPGNRLAGLVEAILAGRDASVCSLDATSGKGNGFADLASCLAWLAVRGHAVDLSAWCPIEEPAEPRKPAHTVELCGANYVKQRSPRPPQPRNRPTPAPAVPIESTPVSNGAHPPATMNTSNPSRLPPDSGALAQALEVTRETLAALQRMQEQTAQLHRQFLEGQDHAQRTVQTLVEQQHRLLQASLGLPVAPLNLPQPVAPADGRSGEPSRTAPLLPSPPASGVRRMDAASGGVDPRRDKPGGLPPAHPQPLAPEAGARGETSAARLTAPTQQEPPRATPSVNVGRVQGVLLEVIAEKTGYPADMLEMGMTLDADLGIDSIKRVEILSALQEKLPDAPAVKPEHLGTLHTLADIAGFLAQQRSAALDNSSQSQPLPPGGRGEQGGLQRIKGVLLEVIAEKTGYPADMLEMGMTLDADLGIDSIKRVEILSALQEKLPEAPAVKPEHLGTLHTLADIAGFLAAERPVNTRNGEAPTRFSEPRLNEGAALERSVVHAVSLATTVRPGIDLKAGEAVYVAGEGPLAEFVAERLRGRGLQPCVDTCAGLARGSGHHLAGLIILAPEEAPTDDWLRDALLTVQRAGPALKQASGVLVTVSRLDGAFGLTGTGLREPIDGGLAGLAKTVRHEWPAVHAKAIDIAPGLLPEQAAEAIIEEFFLSGPVEVGITVTGRLTLERRSEPVGGTHVPWQPGEVVVISGGARGVTAEAAVELARALQPTLVLLGRSPEPGPIDDLESLSDETALKRELSRRTPGLSPRAVGEQAKAVLARRELRANLTRIEQAGARVLYRSVDVRDAEAVARVLNEVRRQVGPIRGLVHGAGVLADARIEDKTPAQFDTVYGTKVGGLRALLAGVGSDELRALVLFSSSTARFGRTGQVDYAMANEVLNKLAWHEAGRRPGCQVVSINWGPWAGGMVTPGLRELFTREGIGLIPLEAGARLLVNELRLGPGGPREVVVLAEGSKIEAPAPAPPRTAEATPLLPPALPTAFERVLGVDDYPVLADHVLDGRPVLPTVLMLEWLAHAAIVQNPGLLFHGCDDLRVLQGVTLDGPRAPSLRIGASKATRKDGFFVAAAELRSVRPDGREVLHARAEIVLASSLPAGPSPRPAPHLAPYEMTAEEAYRQGLLFHGPRMHAVTHVEGCGTAGVIGQVQAAPPPGEWVRQALRPHWLADPLVLDGSLQLVILWTRQQRGAANLPCHIRRYRQWRRNFPADGARVVVFVERSSERLALCDMDFVDAEGRLIARLEGYECVIDPSLERAYRRNALVLA
jgi:acyl transferase domain-containing protein/NAD(P)-dependent dehydrogenase (short-subunit alcohol dehydrogenase family)/acyl carrier protein